MRFAVETWAPEFGAPVGGDVIGESDAEVDIAGRAGAGRLGAHRARRAGGRGACCSSTACSASTPGCGSSDDDGGSRQGVCASWAAGVVRCDGRAEVVAAEVRRGVLCPGDGVEPIATRHGDYRAHPVPDVSGGDPLGQALGRARGDLEGRVAVEAGEPTVTCWSSTGRSATAATSTARWAT